LKWIKRYQEADKSKINSTKKLDKADQVVEATYIIIRKAATIRAALDTMTTN
jgi:hypothetical protein